MSYTKREWATGNVVGAVDLNRMEEGIEDAGSGQILVVTDTDGALDKTWQEIYDAFPNVYIVQNGWKSIVTAVYINNINYLVYCYYSDILNEYLASSSNGYPEYKMPTD